MIEKAGTGERVYLAIKTYLAESDLRPGERLDIADLSRRAAASATPIRAALHRLVGERLLTSHQGEGFSIPRITEPALSDLYAWNASLLAQAVRAPQAERPPSSDGADVGRVDDIVSGVERLFAHLATLSGNVEVEWAVAGVNDRLHRVRRLELEQIGDPQAELAELVDLSMADDPSGLRQALVAYHRRRVRLVPALVRVLHGLGDRPQR